MSNRKFPFCYILLLFHLFTAQEGFAQKLYEVKGIGLDSNFDGYSMGIVDSTGKEILPSKYSQVWLYQQKTAFLELGKNRYSDTLSFFRFNLYTQKCLPTTDTLKVRLFFSENEGELITREKGLLPVEIGKKCYIGDLTTHNLSSKSYDGFAPISFIKEGDTLAVRKRKKWGFIQTNDKIIFPFKYQNATNFQENGIALVKKRKKWGILHKSGKMQTNFVYDSLVPHLSYTLPPPFGIRNTIEINLLRTRGAVFSDRYTKYVDFFKTLDLPTHMILACQHKKWGIVNTEGKTILPIVYDKILEATAEYLIVQQGCEKSVITHEGKTIVYFSQDSLAYFNGIFYFYATPKAKPQVFNLENNSFIAQEYDSVIPPENGEIYLRVFKNKQVGWINVEGKVFFPPIYDTIRILSYKEVYVLDSKEYITEAHDAHIRRYDGYDRDKPINRSRYILLVQKGKKGVADLTGKLLVPCEYDHIRIIKKNVGLKEKQVRIEATKNEKVTEVIITPKK